MSEKSFIHLLILTLVLLVAATISSLIQPKFETKVNRGELIFQNLNSELNNISKIKIDNGLNKIVIGKNQTGWVMENKYNYKVKDDVVKENLIQIARLRFFEKKTENPSLYSRIDLHYPNDEEGNSKLILILNQNNEKLSEFIQGKVKKNGIYIKKLGDKSTWLTTGLLSMPIDDNDWLETRIFDIKNEEIEKIKLKHADKSILLVSKKKKENENFVIDNLPKGETPKSDLIANFLSYFLSNLTFEDVIERKEAIKENFITEAEFELFNDIVINTIVFKDGDNKWINFNIDEDSNQKLKNDNLIQVSDIGNWTYKLPKTKYNTIDTKLKDLLVED